MRSPCLRSRRGWFSPRRLLSSSMEDGFVCSVVAAMGVSEGRRVSGGKGRMTKGPFMVRPLVFILGLAHRMRIIEKTLSA